MQPRSRLAGRRAETGKNLFGGLWGRAPPPAPKWLFRAELPSGAVGSIFGRKMRSRLVRT